MLKTIKWIYQLGQRSERRRLFYLMSQQVEQYEVFSPYGRNLDEEDKQRNKDRENDIKSTLHQAIGKVFVPEAFIDSPMPKVTYPYDDEEQI